MNVCSMAIWNLGRRPTRSLLTTLGIAVAVGSFVAIVGLSRGIELAWTNTLMARGTHLLAIQKGTVDYLTTSIDAGVGEQIRQVEGVRDVAGELANLVTIETDHSAVVIGWPLGCFLWGTLRMVEGRLPAPAEDDVLLLGEAAAEALHKKQGDSLQILDRTFKIVGEFHVGGAIGNNAAIIPLTTLQEMIQRNGKVTTFNIRVDKPEEPGRLAAVQSRLCAAFPNLSFVETSSVADNDRVMQLFRAVAWSISAIAIVMALVVVLNTLLMSVIERTREIGILSAIGWPSARIVGMIVLEGLILSLLGGLAGLAFGIGGLHWLKSSPHVRGLLEVEINARLLLEVLLAAFLLGGLGSLYPAWRASRLNTVDALRYE